MLLYQLTVSQPELVIGGINREVGDMVLVSHGLPTMMPAVGYGLLTAIHAASSPLESLVKLYLCQSWI